MIVWVLAYAPQNESGWIIGAYSSEELAEQAKIRESIEVRQPQHLEITKCEVDA